MPSSRPQTRPPSETKSSHRSVSANSASNREESKQEPRQPVLLNKLQDSLKTQISNNLTDQMKRQKDAKSKGIRLVPVNIEANSSKLKNFFKAISTGDEKIDFDKFEAFLRKDFFETAPFIINHIKKLTINPRLDHPTVDYRQYCEAVRKMVNYDLRTIFELFFQMLDHNKDRRLCEQDLFNFVRTIQSDGMQLKILPDVLRVLDRIDEVRKSQGKSDRL